MLYIYRAPTNALHFKARVSSYKTMTVGGSNAIYL